MKLVSVVSRKEGARNDNQRNIQQQRCTDRAHQLREQSKVSCSDNRVGHAIVKHICHGRNKVNNATLRR